MYVDRLQLAIRWVGKGEVQGRVWMMVQGAGSGGVVGNVWEEEEGSEDASEHPFSEPAAGADCTHSAALLGLRLLLLLVAPGG
jgi:hypothetical protein